MEKRHKLILGITGAAFLLVFLTMSFPYGAELSPKYGWQKDVDRGSTFTQSAGIDNSIRERQYEEQGCLLNSQCDDGIFCNGVESCINGICRSSSPIECSEGEVCDEDIEECVIFTPSETECGNGIIEDGEECDDINNESNDGCSSNCLLESGWICHGDPSACYEEEQYQLIGLGEGFLGRVNDVAITEYMGQKITFIASDNLGVVALRDEGNSFVHLGYLPYDHIDLSPDHIVVADNRLILFEGVYTTVLSVEFVETPQGVRVLMDPMISLDGVEYPYSVAKDVEVRDNVLFMAESQGLRIFDIDTLQYYDTIPGRINDIEIVEIGNTVYGFGTAFASPGREIFVYNVTDPSNAYRIENINNPIQSSQMVELAVQKFDNDEVYLYTQSDGLLEVYDVTDPINPQYRSNYAVPGVLITELESSTSTLGMSYSYDGLVLERLDLSDPGFPTPLDLLSVLSTVQLSFYDGYMYKADSFGIEKYNDQGDQVIAEYLSGFRMRQKAASLGEFVAIGPYSLDSGLWDLTDPQNPDFVSNLGSFSGTFRDLKGLESSQTDPEAGYLYVATSANELHIIEVGQNGEVIHKSQRSHDILAMEVAHYNGKKYLFANGDDLGALIFNVTDSTDTSEPIHAITLEENGLTPTSQYHRLAIQTINVGNEEKLYLYLTILENGNYGILIYDVSDPTSPIRIGQQYPMTQVGDIQVEDDVLVIFGRDTNGQQGILFYSLTEGANPVFQDRISSTSATFLFELDGDRLYRRKSAPGIDVFDISQINDVQIVGTISCAENSLTTIVVGDNYVASGDNAAGICVGSI